MNILKLGFAAAAATLIATAAQATVISADDFTGHTGETSVDLGFATATSGPRGFEVKTFEGATGVGVQGGFVAGEIDLDQEFITITYDAPTRISEITLGFLFEVGSFGDGVSEVARITLSSDPFLAGDLSVVDEDEATWSFPGFAGDIFNLSLGTEGSTGDTAGVWQITDPFGDTLVTQLTFTALLVGNPSPSGAANSDFSIVSVTNVPEPGSLALIGAGLAGLGFLGRRRKAA